MGILAWIIFGALAGWIASLLMNTNEEQGAFMNIVVGIVGAMIGGFGARLLGANGVTGFNLSSLFIAIIGSVVLLGLYKAVSHRA
ncbi:GlsB/YeaQ/YmgE family stress response membrane protein [Candidatus Saccharibacteria bacterium]|nr:MAG: GlsB/YeaQ/YmgE family stress response membrane protein [Candidatus Saccharibacteria bacterium]TXG76080.1 MAG: GlsB/YeaQ/YmgE family stress response membrane protein [Patescibacteria group bacterium]